jgi:hypothetical protein
MKLYDIAVEGLELERILEETGGDLTPETEARFDELLKSGPDKINSACCVIKNLTANASALKDEEKRLADRRKSLERQVDSLKGRILIAVDCAFSGKVKTPMFTVWGQDAAGTVSIALAADVDAAELAKVNPTLMQTSYSINNAAVKDHKKLTGEYPAEFSVEETPGKRFLQVR